MDFVKEVEELHKFFVDWYLGDLPQSEMYFERFSKHISEDFGLIPPSGKFIVHDVILDMIWHAHKSMEGKQFHIWIENPKLLWSRGPIHLVSYEEWQEREGEISSRISSAVFEDDPDCRNKLRWLYVHETWLNKKNG